MITAPSILSAILLWTTVSLGTVLCYRVPSLLACFVWTCETVLPDSVYVDVNLLSNIYCQGRTQLENLLTESPGFVVPQKQKLTDRASFGVFVLISKSAEGKCSSVYLSDVSASVFLLNKRHCETVA